MPYRLENKKMIWWDETIQCVFHVKAQIFKGGNNKEQ